MAEEEKKDQVKPEEETPKPEEKPVEKTEDQLFDEAFQEAIREPEKPGDKPIETPVTPPAQEPGKKETEEPKEEPAPKPGDTEHKPTETPKPDAIDWEARAKETEQKMKSWEGRINAANKRAEEAERKLKEKETPTQAKEPEKPANLPGGDVAKLLKEFGEEYPSLVDPIKALAQSIAEDLIAKKLEVIKPLTQKVEAVEKRVSESDTQSHFETIRAAHPDYETVAGSKEFVTWVDSQPAHLVPTYKRIIGEGTTIEVISMLDTYKKSGVPATTSKSKPASDPMEKAKKLQAVPASPGGPTKTKQVDLNDFDAAFAEAMARA